jgi:hypothetical protein
VSAFYSRPTTLEYFQPEQILILGQRRRTGCVLGVRFGSFILAAL